VAAVEEERKVLAVASRWPFILLVEEEPLDTDNAYLRLKEYIVWFFSSVGDELTGTAAADLDSEIAHHNRNVLADIAVALNVDTRRGGYAEHTEILPGTHDVFAFEVAGEAAMLFGTWCRVRVIADVDLYDQFDNRGAYG
jgi:hypothetical protein